MNSAIDNLIGDRSDRARIAKLPDLLVEQDAAND
jgi:hypothetical protein